MKTPNSNDTKARLNVYMDSALIESVRDAAYWERCTLSGFIEEAVRAAITQVKKSHGGAIPKRREDPKPGRPFR